MENVIFLDFKKEKIIDFTRRILLLIARVFLHHLEGKWNVMETLLSAKKNSIVYFFPLQVFFDRNIKA